MNKEHFCTLFDRSYLLQGITLYQSLKKHLPNSVLWVLCMDRVTEDYIAKLQLPDLHAIPLTEIETPGLLAVKPSRSKGEYCWTLTPFLPSLVFKKDTLVERVTYVDSDLFFFESPMPLIEELIASKKDVLITDHAYDPRYDQSATAGRFCVQFISFNRNAEADEVLRWWQGKCEEWCFARIEKDRFGDQKYLDVWPELFSESVHILQQTNKTLAPWNVLFFSKRADLKPTFYHFHYLRILSSERIRLFSDYEITPEIVERIYTPYVAALQEAKRSFLAVGIPIFAHHIKKSKLNFVRELKKKLLGTIAFARF